MKYIKKISLTGSLFALIFAFTFTFSQAQDTTQVDTTEVPQPETYVLKGKVINAQTATVLTDAEISISGKDISTVSDEEGKFILENLPAGTHTLKAELHGYQAWEKDLNLEEDTELEIKLKPKPKQ